MSSKRAAMPMGMAPISVDAATGLLNSGPLATEAKQDDIIAAMAGSVAAGAAGTVPVGATTTAILAADDTRELAIITNLSDERIDLTVGAAAESGKGIPLSAASGESAGGSVTLTGPMAKLAVNGICVSGTKSVATQTGITA